MKKFICFILAISMVLSSVVMVNAVKSSEHYCDDRFENNVTTGSYTVGNEYTVHDDVKYVFAGWSENIDDIDAVTTNYQPNTTYYAIWKKDGKVVVTQNFDFESSPFPIPAIPTGSGISWNPIDKKVYLDGSVIDIYSRTAVIGMLLPSNAKIILTGDNYFTINNPNTNIQSCIVAISGFDKLGIEGTGSLTVNSLTCQEYSKYPIGISANSLNITGGKVYITSTNYGNSNNQWAYGINMDGDLLVSGRDTELKVDSINLGAENCSYGIFFNNGCLRIDESTVGLNTSGSALSNFSVYDNENWVIATNVAIQIHKDQANYSYTYADNGIQTSGALKFGSFNGEITGRDCFYTKYDEVCYIDGNPSVLYPSINTAMLAAANGVETKVILIKDTVENIYNFEDKKIVLDLNGHVVSALGEQCVCYACGDLTIIDSNKNITHYYEVKSNGLWVLTNSAIGSIPYENLTARPNEGTIIAVKGGVVTGGKGGHGIYASYDGILTISGASIIGNAGESAMYSNGVINIVSGRIAGNVGGYNGTINAESGKDVNFFGGEVSFNRAVNGGAFNSSLGRVNMFGGKVLYNYASDNGGAVYNGQSSVSFHMHGGEIKYNEAANNGGGVYDSNSDVSFEGLCTVIDNIANGDICNVYETGRFGINNGVDNVQTALSAGSIIGVTLSSGLGQFTFDDQGLASEASLFVSDNEKYEVVFETNHLSLVEAPLRITANSASKIYDGTALSDSGFTSNAGIVLSNGHVLTVTVAGIITNAGESENKVTEYKIIDGGSIDVTAQYQIVTSSGILHISPRAITLTSASDSKPHDGTPLTNSNVTISGGGFAGEEGATYNVTGSQTEIGSSENTFTYQLNAGTNPNNYTITTVYGVLTVTGNTAPQSPVYVDPDPVITVPVSGDKDTVKVQATVSGSNATVKNVTSDEITKVGTGSNVVMDLTSLSKSVTGVTIPKETFQNIAASNAKGLEIKMPNGTVAVFDKTALAAIAAQAKGNNIQLVIDRDSKAEKSMSAAQKKTVGEMNNPVVLDAYFVSNGTRISDFKGGEAEVTAEYPTEYPVRVWYVSDNGDKELVPSSYDGKLATFTVTHFSHYVVEQLDGSSFNVCPQDATCVYAKFPDTDTKAWYHDGVHYCVEKGIMGGYDNGKFGPSDTLSRAMVVQMLYNMEARPAVSAKADFSDVEEGRWYANAVAWAQAKGIAGGYGQGKFGPEDPITREQLAKILYNYAKLKAFDVSASADLNEFIDAAKTSSWAVNELKWAKAVKLIGGKGGGILDPTGNASRAEAATMFKNFCENIVK